MQSTWYRLPEDEGPEDDWGGPRGGGARERCRGRGRGRSRGRESGRQARDARNVGHGLPAPYYLHALGLRSPMQAPYAPSARCCNPPGAAEMTPHWRRDDDYSIHRAHSHSIRARDEAMLVYRQLALEHAAHIGRQPYYGNKKTTATIADEYCFHGRSPRSAAPLAPVTRSKFSQSPQLSHPACHSYARYSNRPRSDHQLDRKRTGREDRKSQTAKVPANQTEACQGISLHRPQSTNYAKTPDVELQANKTLAETAAFLNRPQLVYQEFNDFTSSLAPLTHPTRAALPQRSTFPRHTDDSAVFTIDPSQAYEEKTTEPLVLQNNYSAHLSPSLFHHEDLGVKHLTDATFNSRDALAQTPDCQKYCKLRVPFPAEPPPAHQATIAQIDKYPDLSTPPVAYQTSISTVPEYLRFEHIHAKTSPTPPPAHQASKHTTIRDVYPSHIEAVQTIHHRSPAQRVSAQTVRGPISNLRAASSCTKKVEITTDIPADHRPSDWKSCISANSADVLDPTNATYNPHETFGEAQVLYQSSTEIYSEQVLYQPDIDLYTKEQIVFQPRKKILARSQVHFQPRTEFMATAETVFQPDTVAARQTIIQPQMGTMDTAEAVYSTRGSSTSMSRSRHGQAKILSDEQTLLQLMVDAQARIQSARSRETRLQTGTYKDAPIANNFPFNESAEPREPQRNMANLQQLVREKYDRVLDNSSYSAISNESFQQTKKRKTCKTPGVTGTHRTQHPAAQPAHALHPAMLAGSSRTPSTPTDIQSIIALNWTLQSLATSWQAKFTLADLLDNLLTSDNAGNVDNYGNNC